MLRNLPLLWYELPSKSSSWMHRNAPCREAQSHPNPGPAALYLREGCGCGAGRREPFPYLSGFPRTLANAFISTIVPHDFFFFFLIAMSSGGR